MSDSFFDRIWILLVAAVALAGCASASTPPPGPRVVQPGAPGEATRVVQGGTQAGPRHTDADVAFMRHMIQHHAQALEMSALAPERSTSRDILLLARRIDVAQRDEMAQMEQWLRSRGEDVAAAPHRHDEQAPAPADDTAMPGMLTQAQMMRLAAARGAEFERLFLEAMIFHHEGALAMVDELFSAPGAGQEAEIFQFASHVDTDQRIEIARMHRLLASITPRQEPE